MVNKKKKKVPEQLSLFQFSRKKRRRVAPALRSLAKEDNLLSAEIITSDVFLQGIWYSLRWQWFPEARDLDAYRVVWSNRNQKRTLASCNLHIRKVLVARELAYEEHLSKLSALLYHEMCHAYIGILPRSGGQRRAWHGPEFKQLEMRHPDIVHLDTWIRKGGWLKAIRSDRTRRARKRRG